MKTNKKKNEEILRKYNKQIKQLRFNSLIILQKPEGHSHLKHRKSSTLLEQKKKTKNNYLCLSIGIDPEHILEKKWLMLLYVDLNESHE